MVAGVDCQVLSRRGRRPWVYILPHFTRILLELYSTFTQFTPFLLFHSILGELLTAMLEEKAWPRGANLEMGY